MLSPDIFKFLNQLSKNNNREWFHENKPFYQACRENFIHNIEFVIHEISQLDKSITGLAPKDCIFRINRDIRFSKDKSPYKTNFGAFMAPGGRNKGGAGYYLHLEPGKSFLAGGIYMPPSPTLKAIRTEIYENYDEFLSIVEDGAFIKHFQKIDAEKLKTRPKGFPADFIGIEYLKFKYFTVLKPLADNEPFEPDFLNKVKSVFEALYPLNRFLNYAIQENN